MEILRLACLILSAMLVRSADGTAKNGVLAQSDGDRPVPPVAHEKTFSLDGFRLQQTDEPLRLFAPKKPRSEQEVRRVDALAWYLTGRLRSGRGNYRAALGAYEKAVELDPKSVEIYRAMVSAAVELKQNEKAVEYALKAIELNPNDYALLRMVGIYLAGRPGRLGQAIDLLERAAKSPTIKKESSYYVTLMRDLGAFYLLTEQPNKAADCYDTVFDARIHPDKYHLDFRTRNQLSKDRTTTFQRIGQVFFVADRIERAIEAYQQAIREQKGRPGALSYDLAQAYFKAKKLDKALEHLQIYFEEQLQSKGKAAYQLLAQILQDMGRSSELISQLEELAKKDPHNNTLQFFLADQYAAGNRLDEAEKLYKATLASSNEAIGYIGLAGIYRRKNQPKLLLESLSKVVGAEETAEKYLPELEAELKAIAEDHKIMEGLFAAGKKQIEGNDPQLDFAGSYLLARLAVHAKKTPAVLQFFRYAIGHQHQPQRVAVLYEQLGSYLQDQKKFAEAARVFREAYDSPALAPIRSNFAVSLVQALESNDEMDAAMKVLVEARKERDTPQLQFLEAFLYYRARRWDEAIQRFQEVIAKYESNEDERIQSIIRGCRISLSNVYVQQGNLQKGEKILEQILAKNPDDPGINNDLGYLWADQGKNLEKAETMIRKAIAAEPENTAYLDSMGWVLFKRNKAKEALGYLQKAAKQPEGQDAVIWDHLGDCYGRLKQFKKASNAWRKALQLNSAADKPDEKLADRVQKKLKNGKK